MIKGIVKIFEIILNQAEQEYYSESAIQKKLMELNILYEDGEISQEEYDEIQDGLIERLLEIRQRKSTEREED